jgi:predicted small metal-binding protein
VRVIECNYCGETLSAENDDELRRTLSRHTQEQHPDVDLSEDDANELVASTAYSATDS